MIEKVYKLSGIEFFNFKSSIFNLNMEKIKNLHDVSSFYFFVLAFFYIGMTLALRNGYLADLFLGLMRILDLPFAFIALLYGGTTLALQLNFNQEGQVKSSGWVLIISIVCLLLFTSVAIINFAFPVTF